ncbi:MAG: alpha/beta hydrolase [Pseudomonadota bacterium]|nr:alpha/beta hydrolase [Pseudomonadota bacterium]
MSSHTETVQTVAGVRIKLMRGSPPGQAPTAQTLLFLHGAGGASVWLPFMAQLATDFDLLVPEHPGFGDSDTPDWLDRVEDLAYYYLDLLEELDLSGVHLVGHSLGGWTAASLAIKDCTRLQSLTLISAAGVHVRGVKRIDNFMGNPEENLRGLIHDQAIADTLLAMELPPEERERQLKNRFTTAKLVWQPRSYDPHLPKWLHRIRIPTQVVWGDNDRLFPPRIGEEYAARIPGAQLNWLEGCGHLPPIEQPAACAQLVARFARDVAAQRGAKEGSA